MTSIELEGTPAGIASGVLEIERHVHNRVRVWGAVAVPDETNAIEANVNRPFVAISGNNDWGAAIPICGTADMPVPTGDTKHDPNGVLVVDTDHSTAYRLRIIYGTGTSAEAIAAEQWSETPFITASGPFLSGATVEVKLRRVDVGTKLWAQVWNATNLSEVDFFWGTHGYLT